MVIHDKVLDHFGAGKWDVTTLRYVPLTGGSRSRLPVADDPDYRRYPGFVGIDEHLTPSIFKMAQLYVHLGGKAIIPEGDEGKFTQLILEQAEGRLAKQAPDEEEEQPAPKKR